MSTTRQVALSGTGAAPIACDFGFRCPVSWKGEMKQKADRDCDGAAPFLEKIVELRA
jgi:hypothetical protein